MYYLETPANPELGYKCIIGFLWHHIYLTPHYLQFILMSPESPDLCPCHSPLFRIYPIYLYPLSSVPHIQVLHMGQWWPFDKSKLCNKLAQCTNHFPVPSSHRSGPKLFRAWKNIKYLIKKQIHLLKMHVFFLQLQVSVCSTYMGKPE